MCIRDSDHALDNLLSFFCDSKKEDSILFETEVGTYEDKASLVELSLSRFTDLENQLLRLMTLLSFIL